MTSQRNTKHTYTHTQESHNVMRHHVPDQEVVVLHHTPDGLEADRGPDVPGPPLALDTEHVPQPALLHLLGAPPVEILPGYRPQNLN